MSVVVVCASTAAAQDIRAFLNRVQVHGNAAQGFLYSSHNNYMTTGSNDGSGRWTEASLNATVPITERLRAGAQAHSYSFGQLGRQNVMLDWAYVEYKFSSLFAVRAGQVKTPIGLFNEIQDVDAVHQWAALPQSFYTQDSRSFNLAHQGGIIQGQVRLSRGLGSLEYSAFGGRRAQRRNEGFNINMASQGINVGGMGGPIVGVDLRWRTPLAGLTVGAAYTSVDLTAPDAKAGPMPLPLYNRYKQQMLFAQYDNGKVTLSAEYKANPVFIAFGPAPERYSPLHAWYGMFSYRATDKLTLGTYYDETWFFMSNRNRQDPANYLKNVALNARYDVNRFVYLKFEGHYLRGNAGGFYGSTNPNGLDRVTRLAMARVGFAF